MTHAATTAAEQFAAEMRGTGATRMLDQNYPGLLGSHRPTRVPHERLGENNFCDYRFAGRFYR